MHFYYLQTSWVVTDSAGLFSLPANLPGEMVYTDDGDELPPGSVPLNSIRANSILYCGFLIPLSKSPFWFSFKDVSEIENCITHHLSCINYPVCVCDVGGGKLG